MSTRCTCGNPLSDEPERVPVIRKPCQCATPARRAGSGISILIPGTPRDPARAKLGLPDRTPLEKAVLRGTPSE